MADVLPAHERLLRQLATDEKEVRRNRAARALKQILEQSGLSQIELSQALGVTAPGPKDRGKVAAVHRWLKGHDVPARKHMQKIEALQQGLLRLAPTGVVDGRTIYELVVRECPECGGFMRRELGLDLCDWCGNMAVPVLDSTIACDPYSPTRAETAWEPNPQVFAAALYEYRARIWGQQPPVVVLEIRNGKVTPEGIQFARPGTLVAWRNYGAKPVALTIGTSREHPPLPAIGRGECVGVIMPRSELAWFFEEPFYAAGTVKILA